MLLRRFVASVALGCVMASPASATFVSGDLLASYCATNKGTYAQVYIAGATDMLQLERLATEKTGHPANNVCVPPTTSAETLLSTLCDYVRAHPEHVSLPAPSLVILAMQTSYPCVRQ